MNLPLKVFPVEYMWQPCEAAEEVELTTSNPPMPCKWVYNKEIP